MRLKELISEVNKLLLDPKGFEYDLVDETAMKLKILSEKVLEM